MAAAHSRPHASQASVLRGMLLVVGFLANEEFYPNI
jgi:hypothetical protein